MTIIVGVMNAIFLTSQLTIDSVILLNQFYRLNVESWCCWFWLVDQLTNVMNLFLIPIDTSSDWADSLIEHDNYGRNY